MTSDVVALRSSVVSRQPSVEPVWCSECRLVPVWCLMLVLMWLMFVGGRHEMAARGREAGGQRQAGQVGKARIS